MSNLAGQDVGYGQETKSYVFSCTLERNQVNIGEFNVYFTRAFYIDCCPLILSMGDYLQ